MALGRSRRRGRERDGAEQYRYELAIGHGRLSQRATLQQPCQSLLREFSHVSVSCRTSIRLSGPRRWTVVSQGSSQAAKRVILIRSGNLALTLSLLSEPIEFFPDLVPHHVQAEWVHHLG